MDCVDISIIIPTVNRQSELLQAIQSVLRQQGITLEVIVVDDSGEGLAQNVVTSVVDGRVRYIRRSEPSCGRPAIVRNQGASVARGRYLYFLDDDDLMMPDTLRIMREGLEGAPAAGMVFGVVEPFGNDEAVLRHEWQYFGKARRIARRLRSARALSARLVFLSTILVNSACMARRSAFETAGGYDADIPICEDTELWGRLADADGYVFIDRPVVRYRTGAPSMMHNLHPDDEKLRISYQRIQGKYRRTHGLVNYVAMKLWLRAVSRFD